MAAEGVGKSLRVEMELAEGGYVVNFWRGNNRRCAVFGRNSSVALPTFTAQLVEAWMNAHLAGNPQAPAVEHSTEEHTIGNYRVSLTRKEKHVSLSIADEDCYDWLTPTEARQLAAWLIEDAKSVEDQKP